MNNKTELYTGLCGASSETIGRVRLEQGLQSGGGHGRRERRGHVRVVQSGPEQTHLERALQSHRLVRRGHPGAGRAQPGRHAMQTSRAVHQEGETTQTSHICAQQMRSRAHMDNRTLHIYTYITHKQPHTKIRTYIRFFLK